MDAFLLFFTLCTHSLLCCWTNRLNELLVKCFRCVHLRQKFILNTHPSSIKIQLRNRAGKKQLVTLFVSLFLNKWRIERTGRAVAISIKTLLFRKIIRYFWIDAMQHQRLHDAQALVCISLTVNGSTNYSLAFDVYLYNINHEMHGSTLFIKSRNWRLHLPWLNSDSLKCIWRVAEFGIILLTKWLKTIQFGKANKGDAADVQQLCL